MDVALLLQRARLLAGLTRTALASRAGTSPAALRAYEQGTRSPTVATLDRILAVCNLQVPSTLEPLLAEVDAAVDALLDGKIELPWGFGQLVSALATTDTPWAIDGTTALALHGLAAPHDAVAVAFVDSQPFRFLLRNISASAVGLDGCPLFESWLELDLTKLSPHPTYTRHGFVRLRVVDRLPHPVHMALPDLPLSVPVLSLLAVEQAHPGLAAVLSRLRERQQRPPARTVSG